MREQERRLGRDVRSSVNTPLLAPQRRRPKVRLRQEREQRGWSQAHVARHVGTDARTVGRWERGATSPSPHFRTRLCELFQSDASTLGLLHADDEQLPHEGASSPSLPLEDPFLPRLLLPHDHLVGRETLIQEVLYRLQQRGMCTLQGLPGVGKTTLAHALAHHPEIPHLFPDGVLWISPGPTPDLPQVFAHWGALLGVPEAVRTKEHPVEQWSFLLRERLRHRRVLLIVDDAWTLETSLPLLIGGSGCGHLLTTRFPALALSLSVEPPIHVPELTKDQSFHLLTTLVPALLEGEHEEVSPLLERTGGLPLALMLLGKYLRSHAYSGQQRRLLQALRSLSEDQAQWSLSMPFSPSAPPNPATHPSAWSLETVIGNSDVHLPPEAQQAFRALSVLPAKPHRFSEAAALAVMGQDASVLDLLSDAGLVESAGSGWYVMHQTIVSYGRKHLHDLSPWTRLVQYALHLSETAREDHEALEQEHTTLLSALDATTTQGWGEQQVVLTKQLCRFWIMQGHHVLARQRLMSALVLTQQLGDRSTEGWIRHKLGILLDLQSHTHEAQRLFEDGLSLIRSLQEPDRHLEGAFLNSLGVVLVKQGKLRQAEDAYNAALQVAYTLERSDEISMSLGNVGAVALYRGQVDRARDAFLEGLARVSEHNAPQRAQVWIHLGSLATFLGQYEEALTCYHQAHAQAGGPMMQCQISLGMGTVAYRQSMYEEAESWLEQGHALACEGVLEELRMEALASRAELALARGELEQAEALVEQALMLAQDLGYGLGTALIQTQMGWVRLAQGRVEHANRCFASALTFIAGEGAALEAEIVYGQAHVAVAQQQWSEAKRLGEKAIQHFVSLSHWKIPMVRVWREQLVRHMEEEPPHDAPLPNVIHHVEGESPTPKRQELEKHICPSCTRSDAVIKRGKTRAGTQRFFCTCCNQSFVLTRVLPTNGERKERVCQLAKAGWSHRAIAQQVGIHYTTVSRWLGSIDITTLSGGAM